MNTLSKILIVTATAATLAACGTTPQCTTGRTIWYEDTDGVVKNRPETFACPRPTSPGPNMGGIFSEGHMPAPAAGQGWNN